MLHVHSGHTVLREVRNMGKDPTHWDDIPTLDGMEMDWEYTPASANGNRAGKRMSEKELTTLFGTSRIPVRTVADNYHQIGTLHDICEGGLAVLLDAGLTENQPVKVGLVLGRREIISQAVVRHVDNRDKDYRIGMQFRYLARENKEYLAEIYGAKVLNLIRE